MLVILLLGFSSGLPFALSFGTLSVWFTEVGVRKAEIGLFVLVSLPYSWKFLWAPLMDRLPVPVLTKILGQRRSWALVAQAGLMASLVWLGSLDPAHQLGTMAWAAFLVVFMAASQDVVVDAYRIEVLADEEQGAGGAMVQYGYRLGMITSGAGALYLSDLVSWSRVYVIEAMLIGIGMATILASPEPAGTGLRNGSGEAGSSAAGDVDWFQETVVRPFADFMRRPWWALILAFVVLYRFPDAFLSVMANVFYKDIGFTNSEIASVSKVFGTGATLVGVFAGGLVVHRYGVLKGLLVCGVVQMLSNLMYVLMAQRGDHVPTFAVTIAVENVSGGMGGAAFVAYLSSLCSRGFAGTQYALLSALGLSSRNAFSAVTGWLAEQVSWTWFFVISTVVAIPGMLLLLVFLWRDRSARGGAAGRGP